MATDSAWISHSTIDRLEQSTKVRYLRRTLISAGVLPEIDVLLHDLDVYAHRLLARMPTAHAVLVGRYFRWSLAPAIRRMLHNRTMTAGIFSARRGQLRQIADFLQWLDQNGMTMQTVDQPAIDRFVSGNKTRQQVGPFVTWAVKEGFARDVSVTPVRSKATVAHLSDDDLYELTERVFMHGALPLPVRLITLFSLVFAQPVEASVALTREQVHESASQIAVTFAKTPIALPARLAALVRQHLEELDARRLHHPNEMGWLFPGTMPNQHLTPSAIERVASQHGFSLRHFRASRLQHFAQTIPASVVADVVGVTTNTAYRRSIDAGGSWRHYPGLRQDTTNTQSPHTFHRLDRNRPTTETGSP
ncbi:hypothetical protein ACFVWL_01610 [Microbacterium sp. NPDC058269]|uniref:hypothetical protein n=1 Tax=Microbacterium sp. NPDC058269 TaxID=3346414 RepID=UPI0036D83F9C